MDAQGAHAGSTPGSTVVHIVRITASGILPSPDDRSSRTCRAISCPCSYTQPHLQLHGSSSSLFPTAWRFSAALSSVLSAAVPTTASSTFPKLKRAGWSKYQSGLVWWYRQPAVWCTLDWLSSETASRTWKTRRWQVVIYRFRPLSKD